jgi:hypothetical protein
MTAACVGARALRPDVPGIDLEGGTLGNLGRSADHQLARRAGGLHRRRRDHRPPAGEERRRSVETT